MRELSGDAAPRRRFDHLDLRAICGRAVEAVARRLGAGYGLFSEVQGGRAHLPARGHLGMGQHDEAPRFLGSTLQTPSRTLGFGERLDLAGTRRYQPAEHLCLVADLVFEGFVGAEGPQQAARYPADGSEVVLVHVGQVVDGEHGCRSFTQGRISLHVGRVVAEPLGRVVQFTRGILGLFGSSELLVVIIVQAAATGLPYPSPRLRAGRLRPRRQPGSPALLPRSDAARRPR